MASCQEDLQEKNIKQTLSMYDEQDSASNNLYVKHNTFYNLSGYIVLFQIEAWGFISFPAPKTHF